MQFLNNDMDELMRRAAAGYEPAVSGMDWDSVAQKLDEAPPAAPPFASNSRRYGLLALFLLSSLVCNKYLYLNLGKWGVITASEFQQYRRDYGPMLVLEKGKRTSEVLKQNIHKNAWDGEWYVRAYFDDGTPLGSSKNTECRIDAISQSWSVLSEAGDPQRSLQAMESVNKHLVNRQKGLIQLLDPPFDKSDPDPGYIRGYVPGVRENGGQYTHAAIWTVMASRRRCLPPR